MARLDELLRQRATAPLVGLPVEELVAAFRALADSPAVKDKRVMLFGIREGGNLLMVQTGQILGACYGGGEWVLLEKDAKTGVWNVVDVAPWFS
jgi:hypothetical protein